MHLSNTKYIFILTRPSHIDNLSLRRNVLANVLRAIVF